MKVTLCLWVQSISISYSVVDVAASGDVPCQRGRNVFCLYKNSISLCVGPMTCKQIADLAEALMLYEGLLTVLLVLGSSRIR